MEINKNLCEKLYSDVKQKLQNEFIQRGLTFRGSETSIWKIQNEKKGKTYFQEIIEEVTGLLFSTTFNNMYLWKKQNEVQVKESVHFHEDYLQIFVRFLGYEHPQAYIKEFSLTLHHFFGIKNEGKIVVIQPIFDANKDIAPPEAHGKFPLANEQTVDSRDTECLLEIITLFHNYHQRLPQRIYDQDFIQYDGDKFTINETYINQNKINCIFSIGFYSNYFFRWVLQQQLGDYIEYLDSPVRFRVKYFNTRLQKPCWTNFYSSDENFKTGFLLKYPVRFTTTTINCYFFCGIENTSTKVITSYLCSEWKTIQGQSDIERGENIEDAPFVQIFKINRTNLNEFYTEKIIKIDLL